ncbi:5-oxoprolinase subunit PxpA [Aestuariirhabdus sp. Z084]|uniref:5-oxoprolinase subunit PxpA n=1 Tax=Aestuariirhabdus haliotis TaxID=2918751 RepID=UPI00201B3CA4|nr:5-oxoprolinase subunit PxpA [Aestuariirhabdus haliotis]MCL6417500.1 5-oxoprolinase subunit PxpA [Aestuariirhabdus haliotis]MCL6421456.1 5-oxoprolinase subunit PxpA [Aestuariirhabdus haliotis]
MLRLNCDLGESFGAWTMGMDAKVMPFIDQANIACGFHAGDPVVMQQTLALAKQHGVMVGAHPGYHDLVGFGRRSMNCQPHEIEALLMYQVSALDGMARVQGLELEYVKPHGALYNDMMANAEVRHAIMNAIASYHRPVVLMLQATPQAQEHREEAQKHGISLWFEAFADRCYDDDGRLLSRTRTGAVHSRERMLEQVQQLAEDQSVTTVSGHRLQLTVDTLCVHGDNAEGVAAIQEIREAIS